MGPNFPGGPPSGGPWTYSDDGGKRRKRKKRKRGLFGTLVSAIIVGFALSALILAIPLFLQFDPWDAAHFVDAPGLAKIEAFMDGWRHKREISEMKFSHNGRSITFTDENGTLTGVDAKGYDYGDGEEYESDLAEARRMLKEWGLD